MTKVYIQVLLVLHGLYLVKLSKIGMLLCFEEFVEDFYQFAKHVTGRFITSLNEITQATLFLGGKSGYPEGKLVPQKRNPK